MKIRELGIRSAKFVPVTALALAAGVLSIGDASADMKAQGKLNVEMYGIITRALLYADDGDKHQLFNVDGGSENTRLGFAVSGKLSENWDVGGVLENNLANSNPASSATLGANGESTTDSTTFGIRVAEIALRHKSAGTFTLGQGNAASVDRVAVDLSGWGPPAIWRAASTSTTS
jgi:predicted porin